MYRLLEFIRTTYVAVLFVVIETAAIACYARSSAFTEARILSRIDRLTGSAYSALAHVRHYFSLPDENRKLLERVVELENRIALYRDLGFDGDTLQVVPAQFTYSQARVVSNSINKQHNFLMLDKGLRQDVSAETAVLTPDGAMVGYVVGCSDRYSVAISVLNTTFRASGKIRGDGHFGSISWDGFDPRHVTMRELSKYADIHVGDTVVTTGFSRYFPENVPIGSVERFSLNETKTAYEVEVRLAADMTALRGVLLVRNNDRGEQQQLVEDSAAWL